MCPNVIGMLRCDLTNRKLGGSDDRLHGRIVAALLRPSNRHIAGLLADVEANVRVLFQPAARGLKNCGNGCADDVLPVFRGIGVTPGKERGQPIAAVPAKRDLEHSP